MDKHLTQNLYKRQGLFSYDIYSSGQYYRLCKFGVNVDVVQVQVTKAQRVVVVGVLPQALLTSVPGGVRSQPKAQAALSPVPIAMYSGWAPNKSLAPQGPGRFKSSSYCKVRCMGPTKTSCPQPGTEL